MIEAEEEPIVEEDSGPEVSPIENDTEEPTEPSAIEEQPPYVYRVSPEITLRL